MSIKFKNFAKSSHALIAELLAESNIASADNFVLKNIAAAVGVHNTTANLTVGLVDLTLKYNRLDLTRLFSGVPCVVPMGTYINAIDLLPAINLGYGLGLTSEDIVDDVIVLTNNKFVIRSGTSSLAWIGSLEVTVLANEQVKPQLSAVFPAANGIEFNPSFTLTQPSYVVIGTTIYNEQTTKRINWGYVDITKPGSGGVEINAAVTLDTRVYPYVAGAVLDDLWWTDSESENDCYLYMRATSEVDLQHVPVDPLLYPALVTINENSYIYDGTYLVAGLVRYKGTVKIPVNKEYVYVVFSAGMVASVIPIAPPVVALPLQLGLTAVKDAVSPYTVEVTAEGIGADGTIDWGDGSVTPTLATQTHTYLNAGEQVISISGDYSLLKIVPYSSDDLIVDKVIDWGGSNVNNIRLPYSKLASAPATLPATLTSLEKMFDGCYGSWLLDISGWDTSNVITMKNAFLNCNGFNVDISGWDTSKVRDMSGMFGYCDIFNQPIGNWNTGAVLTMKDMFVNAPAFNQPIGNWNVSNVRDMSGMFSGYVTHVFNQPLNTWNVASVIDMNYMFYNCKFFNQPLNSWNTFSVTNMFRMFSNASVFNQPLDGWNVSNVVNMGNMFDAASAFNQPLSSWNTGKVNSMYAMFYQSAFQQNIRDWNVQLIGSYPNAFVSAMAQNDIKVPVWGTRGKW